MTAHEVVQEARRRGITLTLAGANLRVRGTEGSLSEGFKRELKRLKPEILVILQEARPTYPCSRCERFVFIEPDVVCYWCREVPHEA